MITIVNDVSFLNNIVQKDQKCCFFFFHIPKNILMYSCAVGPLDVIDVDWSSLMPKHKQEPRAAGAALLRFTPGAVLLRAGISKRLAGPELLEQVREVCKRELEDPKGETIFCFFLLFLS